jgi:glutamate-5-semialdehyde dehydrogenase
MATSDTATSDTATDARAAVEAAASEAAAAAPAMAAASPEQLDEAIRDIAARLRAAPEGVLDANRRDVAAAEGRLSAAMVDRLRVDGDRLAAMAAQLERLAELPALDRVAGENRVGEVRVQERRVPIGVVGANYEARANVTVDIASQLVKSGNAGVLRTGSAALGSAEAILDGAVAPALAAAGLDPRAVQLVRTSDRQAARELVSMPELVRLVILRGSGETTAELARTAAAHGVRTLAHADGGGVLYVHPSADRGAALQLIADSLDRLGVCNRLNLLLVDADVWDDFVPAAVERLGTLGITASLPPHEHALGHEWALDDDAAATVTIAPAHGPADAARQADAETSGLAAGIAAADEAAARAFIAAYRGTGAFWNVPTRLLDGFKLTGAPETGINVDHVPGPRGPVTYRDLSLRQYVVTPAAQPPPV